MVSSIDTSFRSHIHLNDKEHKKIRISTVSEDNGYEVSNYQELVHAVARISQWHRKYSLFFRGQTSDYMKENLKRKSNQSTLRPTLFRPKPGRKNLSSRYRIYRQEILEKCCKLLIDQFKDKDFEGATEIVRYKELQWALLQHYEVCPTPLVDVTLSLRVAASVASESKNKRGEEAYVYVLGLPHPNGSITYAVDEDLMIMKLQSICPPEASRPHFQEGYLVGAFPPSNVGYDYELRRRLVAKFRLNLTKFWSKEYSAIPDAALMPKNDQMLDFFNSIISDLHLNTDPIREKMGLI